MNVLILTASPNRDGLTAECAQRAAEGLTEAGAEAKIICLNNAGVGLCRACESGWGPCRTKHRCRVEDGFQALHAEVCGADALVLVTPVYYGQMAEAAKAFFDRLRRCEATRGESCALAGKPAIGVAAAGGSGGGTVSCLDEMNRLLAHLRMQPFDLITVTQKSRPYKPDAIAAAARTMARPAPK